MTARRSSRKPKTVQDESYTELEMYCIWLNEYYKALIKAGFKAELALTIMMDKTSYPDWIRYRLPTDGQIIDHLEDEDE